MTTLPELSPLTRYSTASLARSKGNIRSITRRISFFDVLCQAENCHAARAGAYKRIGEQAKNVRCHPL